MAAPKIHPTLQHCIADHLHHIGNSNESSSWKVYVSWKGKIYLLQINSGSITSYSSTGDLKVPKQSFKLEEIPSGTFKPTCSRKLISTKNVDECAHLPFPLTVTRMGSCWNHRASFTPWSPMSTYLHPPATIKMHGTYLLEIFTNPTATIHLLSTGTLKITH